MMSKIFQIILFCISTLSAQESELPFTAGEQLEYRIHYGLLEAGKAKLIVQIKNDDFQFIANGKSTGLFKLFFKVKDRYESVVDKKCLCPIYFYRDVQEGKYKKKEAVFFNYTLQQAETTRDTIALPKNTQDLLSAFYYVRAQNYDSLKVGDKIHLEVFLDDEFMSSQLYYLGKDTIKTKFGWMPSTLWSPELETGRVFEDNYGMKIWLSDDENKIPLRIESKVLVGSIKMDLIKHKGLIEPLNQMKKQRK